MIGAEVPVDGSVSYAFLDRTGQARQEAAQNDSLKKGGGGGSSGGMEQRLTRVEAYVEHLQTDVTGLRGDMRDVRDRLARLEEKVSHLPGKGFIVASTVTTLAVVAALIGFQAQIQAFFTP